MKKPLTYRVLAAAAVVSFAFISVWALARCGEDLTSLLPGDTGDDGKKIPCKNNAQCKAGQICKDGFCAGEGGEDGGPVHPCSSSLECGEGEECKGGRCVPVGEGDGGGDEKDGSLPNGDADGCSGPASCGAGYHCNNQTHQCEPAAVIAVDPVQLDFGAAAYNSEVTLKLTVSNTGKLELKVLGADFDQGTNPDPQKPIFRMNISALLPATLKPGEYLTFDVSYRQDDARPDNGALLITSTDLNTPLTRVPMLSHYKGVPELSVVDRSKNPPEVLYPKSGSTDEYPLDLGAVALGANKQAIVTLMNATQGEAILSLDEINVHQKTANEFLFSFWDALDPQKELPLPIFLSPGDMADLHVDYSPTQKVDDETDADLVTNDDDVNGDGTGGSNILYLKVKARAGWVPPGISVSKAAVAFGEVQINTTADEAVQVCNVGGSDLKTLPTSGLEFPSTEITINPASPARTLGPTECFDIVVSYAPTTLAQANNNLVIDSDDPANPRVTVPITGTGTDPTVSVFPQTIDFGKVYVGSQINPVTVTVKNTGTGMLTVTSIERSAGTAAAYTLTGLPQFPASLRDKQQDSLVFSVVFNPTSTGVITGAVEIYNSDAKSPKVVVPLTGNAEYAIGTPCSAPADCPNAFCVDGFCCAEKCDAICERCDIAGKIGTCSPAPLGQDPDSDCVQEGEMTCGRTGECSGARGKCDLYPQSTVCQAQSCQAGVWTKPKVCDGSGTCTTPTPATADCAPYVCNAQTQSCYSACTTGSECMAGFACSAGGECKKADGVTCQAGGECASGFCADGVCCNMACDGTCERCNIAGRLGKCDPIPQNADYDNECNAEPAVTCGNTGNCNGNRGCEKWPVTTQCSAAQCSGNVSTLPDMCDGNGNCVDAGTKDCVPYTCNTLTGLCKVQCANNGDCQTGYACKTQTQQCLKDVGQTCANNSECASNACCSNVCRDTKTDVNHCGACGTACTNQHGTTSCSNGACSPTCSPANQWGNCDGDPNDGCETQLNSTTNCGACGSPCDPQNATGGCSTYTCLISSCDAGYSNCDSNPGNGCELNHATYANTCATADNVGSHCGDEACGPLEPIICPSSTQEVFATRTGNTSKWFKARVSECSDCLADVYGWVSLGVPAGTDYDLCIYTSCGTLLGCAAEGGVGGNESTGLYKTDGGLGGDDSFDYWIEVKYMSGDSCDSWTLSVIGTNC
jgi:hypothetical protein